MTKHLLTMIAAAVMGGMAFSATAAETVYVNETSRVGTDKANWGGSATYGVNVTPEGGSSVGMVEFYTDDKNQLTVGFEPLKQTVTGLPNGTYRVSIYAMAQQAWNKIGDTGLADGVESTTANEFFVTSGANTYQKNIVSKGGTSYTTPNSYTIDNVEVTDGTLTMGIKLLEAARTNWYTIQIKALERETDEAGVLEAAIAALNAAKTNAAELLSSNPDATAESKKAIQDLIDAAVPTTIEEINAATAAFDNANLRRSVIETNAVMAGVEGVTNMTDKIKDPTADGDYASWTVKADGGTNFGQNKSGESPTLANGQTVAKYFDGWSGSMWTVTMHQTINLPAGKYRLSVLARASESGIQWFRLCETDNGTLMDEHGQNNSKFNHVDVKPIGSSGGEFGRGWNLYYLDFEVSTDKDVNIGVEARGNGNTWFGFTNFQLVQYEKFDALHIATTNLMEAKQAAEPYLTQYADASAESINALKSLVEAEVPATVDEINAAITEIDKYKRAIIETNAVCASMEGVVDYTSLIVNPCATEGTGNEFPGWALAQKDGGAKMEVYRDNNQRPTLSDGTRFNYFNPANWGGSDWTTSMEQTIELPAGKYRLSVLGRGSENLKWFRMVASKDIPAEGSHLANGATTSYPSVNLYHQGASGGVFGNGWNMSYVDFEINTDGQVCIAVQASAKEQHLWQSFTDFRIVKYADAAPVLPTVKVNDTEEPGESIEIVNGAKITFDIPGGVDVFYKWDPVKAVETFAAENEAEEGYTKYTEPIELSEPGTLTYYAQRGTAKTEPRAITVSITTGVENVVVAEDGEAEYFNLNGVRVDAARLAPGVYVKRTASGTSKVIVR